VSPVEAKGFELTGGQRRVADHGEGPLLVTGVAGSGRTGALAARLVALAGRGVPPDRVLCLARSRAGVALLRSRVDAMLEGPHEELWITTYEGAADRLLREYAVEAGLDPFFAILGRADRLALLLDRLDELPLRRHEIRGNPAGLLARLLARIDALKREGIDPTTLRESAARGEPGGADSAERERARREIEFADLYEHHDRLLRAGGSLDAADAVLALVELLGARADVRAAVAERFPFLLVDELEDAAGADRRMIEALAAAGNVAAACDPPQGTRALGGVDRAVDDFRRRFADAEQVELGAAIRHREPISTATLALRALIDGDAGDVAADPDGPGSRGGSVVRLWRCRDDRAQAQAVAREVEHLLASGTVRPERVCVVAGSGWREARLAAAAFEERGVPYRFLGEAALFQRPEVRDALAWLRLLADPTDSAAVVRALTRPPVELRSVDLARCTTIARRRKLDMVSAVEAALDSPQLGPEARDRLQSFLRLRAAAEAAMEEMRPDAFVRRLIERVGLRRHRLFAATPETAERLQSLSRLAERAVDWARREPRGSVRDFIRQLGAVADAGELEAAETPPPEPGAAVIAEPGQLKSLEFDHVYLLGLTRSALAGRDRELRWLPAGLLAEGAGDSGEGAEGREGALGYLAASRARRALVASWPEAGPEGSTSPSRVYEALRDALAVDEEVHEEELFGPAEGLHATYRMVRDEVLEASWRAGSTLSEMRLDTPGDVDAAVARYLELLKLAALIQRPGTEPAAEALAALNELIGGVATPEQRAVLEASPLDVYLIGEERERAARRRLVASQREPSLEQFIPRRGDGLALSASDLDLYRTCPLKYKFARVFAIPQEPTINQRFGILIHQVLERFHSEELHHSAAPQPAGSLDRLLAIFEAGWRRAGFAASDDELQYRDRAVAALARYHERHERADSRPVWLERSFAFAIGPHQLRGRVDRVDRLPDGGYELIDYKTGEAKAPAALAGDVQIALYRLGARAAWEVDPEAGSYWYVLDDERVPVPSAPDDAERVERTVLEVAAGIEAQDFEPRPSYEICSWCDYRLICPASEA
jgi:superfamily I DNA/RNA helicase/RecB family exonuclease